MTELGEFAAIANDIVQAVAVIVLGTWTWARFIHGRLLHHRLQPQIQARWRKFDEYAALVVTVSTSNEGIGRVPLRDGGCRVTVDRVNSGTWIPGEATWIQTGEETLVFARDQFVEPREAVHDECLIILDEDDSDGFALAVRVTLDVEAPGGVFGRSTHHWTAVTIVETPDLGTSAAGERKVA